MRRLLLALTLAFLPVLSTPAEVRGFSRELALETFDEAWKLIYTSHFDSTFNGVDWLALKEELRPRAAECKTNAELRFVIWDMLLRLKQSHFGLIPAEPEEALAPDVALEGQAGDERVIALLFSAVPKYRGMAEAGFDIILIDDEPLVWRVWPEGAAWDAGVKPGWKVVGIDNRPIEESFAFLDDELPKRIPAQVIEKQHESFRRLFVQTKLAGKPGTVVTVVFEDGETQRRILKLNRSHGPGEMARVGQMPPMRTNVTGDWVGAVGAHIARIQINAWMPPVNAAFPAVLDTMRQSDGLILDLRGNPGGVGQIAQAVAGYLVSQESALGRFQGRKRGYPLRIVPRLTGADGKSLESYDGPIAVLVDRGTGSTSEVFAAGMVDLGRVHLFGEPTAGAALPARISPLPNGDNLLHATFDFIRPNGHSVEGNPLVPSETHTLTREDLLQGRDPALEAAIAWIAAGVKKEVVVDE